MWPAGASAIADSITAAATVGALGAAIAAWRAAKAAVQVEVGRDRARQESERRAYAERVSAWAVDIEGRRAERIVLLNDGPQPVYDVELWLAWRGAYFEADRLPVLPHGREEIPFPVHILSKAQALKPQDDLDWPPPRPREFRPLLWFTDARGVRWVRAEDGRLVEWASGGRTDPSAIESDRDDRPPPGK